MSETDNWLGTTSSAYDAAGRRTRLSWRDGNYVDYDYNIVGEMTRIRENGATSGTGLLATYVYDDRGRRTSLTRGNGTTTTYAYDDVSRMTGLSHDFASTGDDVSYIYAHNPAGQIVSNVRSNDAYAWTGHYPVDRNYTTNGLNQYSAAAPPTGPPTAAYSYDANGNLASDGTDSFTYDVDNRL